MTFTKSSYSIASLIAIGLSSLLPLSPLDGKKKTSHACKNSLTSLRSPQITQLSGLSAIIGFQYDSKLPA